MGPHLAAGTIAGHSVHLHQGTYGFELQMDALLVGGAVLLP